MRDGDAGKVLVVGLQSNGEQVGQIRAILGRLEIRVEVRPDRGGAAVVRVPADRLVEALLALEYHGFSRVRAYPDDRGGA